MQGIILRIVKSYTHVRYRLANCCYFLHNHRSFPILVEALRNEEGTRVSGRSCAALLAFSVLLVLINYSIMSAYDARTCCRGLLLPEVRDRCGDHEEDDKHGTYRGFTYDPFGINHLSATINL